MSNIQSMIKAMNKELQHYRSQTQMTLGELISYLSKISPHAMIHGLDSDCDSYRGYYSDLAFEPSDTSVTAKELLEGCSLAYGGVFTGYKGGQYTMDANTPLWVAEFGNTGVKLMGISECGDVITEEESG